MNPRRKTLETIAQTMGREIISEMNDLSSDPPMGFMLMVFSSGGRLLAYVSNADRADMVKLLREQANRMEAGTDATRGEG